MGKLSKVARAFLVSDSDGLWGRVKASGSDRAAREKARDALKSEVWPKGSLLPDFKLRKTK